MSQLEQGRSWECSILEGVVCDSMHTPKNLECADLFGATFHAWMDSGGLTLVADSLVVIKAELPFEARYGNSPTHFYCNGTNGGKLHGSPTMGTEGDDTPTH